MKRCFFNISNEGQQKFSSLDKVEIRKNHMSIQRYHIFVGWPANLIMETPVTDFIKKMLTKFTILLLPSSHCSGANDLDDERLSFVSDLQRTLYPDTPRVVLPHCPWSATLPPHPNSSRHHFFVKLSPPLLSLCPNCFNCCFIHKTVPLSEFIIVFHILWKINAFCLIPYILCITLLDTSSLFC